ncbi:MAG: hypothetical protein Q7N50_02875 [Armatimonadota bacterium]|nr:hypothetical protein [Armatimonadota bacterium]
MMPLPDAIQGYLASRQLGMQRQRGELQQAQVGMGMLAQIQKQQRDQELRGALASGDMDAVAKINPQMAGILAQLQKHKLDTANAQKLADFDANLGQFGTPATPATSGVESVAFEGGRGPDQPARSGTFDIRAALEAKVRAGLLDPLAYQKELDSMNKPVAVGRGGLAARDASGNYQQVMAPPPATATQSPLGRLLAERAALQPGDPNLPSYDTAVTHAINPQAQRIIIPPQPRNLQLTTDAEGNQLIVNPDGTTRPLTTGEGVGVRKPVLADKPMTEFQGKAALYGTRAAQSDKVLKTLENKISTAGLSAAQTMGTAGNLLMSSEQRRVNQAQRDFVNAVLRQESGAVISDAEFENAKKQYFPSTGDDANTINQKRANRQLAIQGFARMSGPKGAAEIKSIIENPLLPGQQPQRRASDSAQVLKFDAQGNPINP